MSLHYRALQRASTMVVGASARSLAVFTCPSKVAQALDWNKNRCTTTATKDDDGDDDTGESSGSRMGTVLTMNITKDHIDLAIASHPSTTTLSMESSTATVTTLPGIPLLPRKRRTSTAGSSSSSSSRSHPLPPTITKKNHQHQHDLLVPNSVPTQLWNVLREHAVCGVLVAWPVQKDSGRCGASCGHVLHILDQLLLLGSRHNSRTVGKGGPPPPPIPVCLYDRHRTLPDEDVWGRAAAYGRAPLRHQIRVHVASREQYYPHHHRHSKARATTEENGTAIVQEMWSDFCRSHWPDLCTTTSTTFSTTMELQQEQHHQQHSTSTSRSPNEPPPPLVATTTTTTKQTSPHRALVREIATPPATAAPIIQPQRPKKRTTTTPLSGKKVVDLFAWLDDDDNRRVDASSSYSDNRALTF